MAEIYLREGSEVYQARIRLAGRLVRKSTGSKCPKVAREEAERLERELNAALIKPGDLTLTRATARMFQDTREKPFSARTIQNYELNLANLIEVLGDAVLRLVDEDKVRHYIREKSKTGKSVMLKRDLAFLSSLFTHAIGWGDCGVTINPVRLVDRKKIADAKARDIYAKGHQVDKLLAACNDSEQRLFISLAVWTGMRHQEIMKLHWDEIDLKHGLITLSGERTKNSCPRDIPLREVLMDTLSNTPKTQRVGYVFKGEKEGQPQYSFQKRWVGIRKRAGMSYLRIHDLRHTFGSWLLQSGVEQKTAMDLLGHKTPVMTNRYSHNSLKSLKKAIDQMNADTL